MNHDQVLWCAELMQVLSADYVTIEDNGDEGHFLCFYRFGRHVLSCYNDELEDQLHART